MATSGRRRSTGIEGLDTVLEGGLLPGRSYVLRGAPGAGKTLLGVSFLAAGCEAGEDVLYVDLEESPGEIRENVASVGLDVEDVEFSTSRRARRCSPRRRATTSSTPARSRSEAPAS